MKTHSSASHSPMALYSLLAALTATPFEANAQIVARVQGFGGVELEFEQVSIGSPTLVFVHGWMCDRTYWRNQTAEFTDEFGVVLLDLGGHGASSDGRSEWTIDSFAQDVAAVLRHLDLTDAVLIGHSMGGPVVAEAAMLEPHRVVGVIGVDTFQYLGAAWIQGEGVPNLVASLEADFARTTGGFVRSMFRASPNPELGGPILEAMSDGDPRIGVPSTKSLFEWYRDRAESSLRAVPHPLATINSSEYAPINLELIARTVPALEVHLMDGVGHFLMLDAPEEFNRLLAATIDSSLARR